MAKQLKPKAAPMPKVAKGVRKSLRIQKGFRIQIRSRHPSHRPLRTLLPRLPFRSVVRLGSLWEGDEHKRVECNSVQSVRNSASKLLMKQCFQKAGVVTADWAQAPKPEWWANKEWVVAKSHHGSRGRGNTLLKTQAEYNAWAQGKTLGNYIFEKFYDYSREYRLHVTKNGCFYTCRKMLRENTPENQRWYRNDSNCVWMLETNPQFDKPSNWNTIITESVKALNAVGLDVGAVDVRVQSATDKKKGGKRDNPQFIILETNSAASHGDVDKEMQVRQKYVEIIPQILKAKR